MTGNMPSLNGRHKVDCLVPGTRAYIMKRAEYLVAFCPFVVRPKRHKYLARPGPCFLGHSEMLPGSRQMAKLQKRRATARPGPVGGPVCKNFEAKLSVSTPTSQQLQEAGVVRIH